MLKMHLEVTKDNKWSKYGNFFCSNIFSEKLFSVRKIYHFGPTWKQEGNRCHGCMQNEFWKWVGTQEILQLNNMSKKMAKTRFLCLANPTVKTFFRRVYRGLLVQM